MFHDVSKIILCGRRSTFATFSEDVLHFRGRRNTLETSDVILRGRRNTLDVSCRVSLRMALSALREVVTRCKFRGRRGIL